MVTDHVQRLQRAAAHFKIDAQLAGDVEMLEDLVLAAHP